MNKIRIIFLAILLIALLTTIFLSNTSHEQEPTIDTVDPSSDITQPPSSNLMPWPLDKGEEREVLLKYGMYVTPDPEQNPISPPERFTGYHTGLDIEILPEEKESTVEVKTICRGKITYTGTAEGYGGVVIQECTVKGQTASVLYGHLNPNSIKVSKGDSYTQESLIAELGKAYTAETGNTRKHLHLGIHKGNHLELLGYVNDPNELDEFIDPLPLLKK